MKRIDANIACPSCQGPLSPRVLACATCDIKVEGPFAMSEFAGLDQDLLHFLRIFVHCEGRIKDMEKALGVSYPTVKAMMAQLKRALHMPESAAFQSADPIVEVPVQTAGKLEILEAMEKGVLTYTEGLRRLKALHPK